MVSERKPTIARSRLRALRLFAILIIVTVVFAVEGSWKWLFYQYRIQIAGELSNREVISLTKDSSPGLILLNSFKRGNQLILINSKGTKLKSWNIPTRKASLLRDCSILTIGLEKTRVKEGERKVHHFDWEGNLLQTFNTPGRVHHDVQIDSSGAVYFLSDYYLPKNSSLLKSYPAQILADRLHKLSPNWKEEWVVETGALFKFPYCAGRLGCQHQEQGTLLKGDFDWTHVNTISPLPANKWYRQGHMEFKPGNILFSPRNFSRLYILDPESRQIVWEYAGDYKGGLEGAHAAHMIPEGFPGAGNILLLDNGDHRLEDWKHTFASFILEVSPATKELIWWYDAGRDFYTNSGGSVQRLRNGNTFISEDTAGRAFEVNVQKEIVWQHRLGTRVWRATKYSLNHCKEFSKIYSKDITDS